MLSLGEATGNCLRLLLLALTVEVGTMHWGMKYL